MVKPAEDSAETHRPWERKLAVYAVASGALLGLPGAAQAGLITNVLPTPVVVNANGTYSLDFDADGTNDVLLSANVYPGGVGIGAYAFVSAQGLNGALIGTDSLGEFAVPLSTPGTVTVITNWSSEPAVLVGAQTLYGKGSVKVDGPWALENGNFHWFAARFQLADGVTTTGWANVYASASSGSSQFIITATAYDAPSTATPEPCTMALFAAGAAGILAWRRRKAARP